MIFYLIILFFQLEDIALQCFGGLCHISTWISHNFIYIYIYTHTHIFIFSFLGLFKWLNYKEATCQARDTSSTPELGRSSGEGNGNLLQHSWLGNPMDRRAWLAAVRGVTKRHNVEIEQQPQQTQSKKQSSVHTCAQTCTSAQLQVLNENIQFSNQNKL